jgi:NAD(P)-dependent dehydrogenase (short-subunit alcohol dehydrogenase family)
VTSVGGGRVAGQVAIVTGGGSGIGRACVLRLASEGATVVVADSNVEGGQSVAEEVCGSAYPVDVTDEAAVAELFRFVAAEHGRIDILVTSAALTDPAHQARDRAVGDLEHSVWQRTLAVDLDGTMLCCKYAVRVMSTQGGGGSIVTISSNSALAGDLNLTSYAAAKAGVNALTMSIATAYGKAGVRANVVSPASISSPSLARNVPPQVVEMLHNNCLLPRMGEPDDVATAVLFLASPEASFITGQVLRVDGGTLSQLPHVPAMRAYGFTTTGSDATREPVRD